MIELGTLIGAWRAVMAERRRTRRAMEAWRQIRGTCEHCGELTTHLTQPLCPACMGRWAQLEH